MVRCKNDCVIIVFSSNRRDSWPECIFNREWLSSNIFSSWFAVTIWIDDMTPLNLFARTSSLVNSIRVRDYWIWWSVISTTYCSHNILAPKNVWNFCSSSHGIFEKHRGKDRKYGFLENVERWLQDCAINYVFELQVYGWEPKLYNSSDEAEDLKYDGAIPDDGILVTCEGEVRNSFLLDL